ncbi:MAG: 6-carboxytetrahydropterin synthase [Bacteroidales bacterium]
MAKIRVTKEFHFEMAHALLGYDGLCKYIHGHSYELKVTVIGSPLTGKTHPRQGMVIDFGDLKKIVKDCVVDEFDHALVLNSDTPRDFEPKADLFHRVIFVPFQPTSENLVNEFAHRISERLPSGVSLHSLQLRETGTSYAEWFATDQD